MLTARVIVNRVWQHHFGRGLVRTANNFGELGTPPTHPELLGLSGAVAGRSQLATQAAASADHDFECLSDVVGRQSQQALAVDPTNDLLWRFDMRRLSAEEIRDAALVSSGQFNPTMFGPGFYPKLSQEVLATQSRPGDGWGQSTAEEQSRRSIYMHVKRSLLAAAVDGVRFSRCRRQLRSAIRNDAAGAGTGDAAWRVSQ